MPVLGQEPEALADILPDGFPGVVGLTRKAHHHQRDDHASQRGPKDPRAVVGIQEPVWEMSIPVQSRR